MQSFTQTEVKWMIGALQEKARAYAHMRGYQHVPVSGSFSEKRRDAAE